MSIPRPELEGIPASLPQGTSDPFGPDLVARLANEFFSASPGAAPVPTPTVPSALAGLPASAAAPSLHPTGVPNPEIPAPASSELSGGYPTTSSTPPVHPVLEADSSHPTSGAASGAHSPDSQETYAFGEPRLNTRTFGSSPQRLNDKEAPLKSTPASFDSAGDAPSIPGIDVLPANDFYFLSERPGKSKPSALPPVSAFDVEAVRRDFPILHQEVNGHPLIWLDNAATTQKPRRVIDATSDFYSRDNSNIHRAAYALAERSTKLFEAGREKVRQFLGARDAKEIVFVRGTTEAINLVAQSFGRENVGAGDEILLTELEHHANIVPWQILAQQVGASIRVVPINDRGELVLEEYARLLNPRTKIVSVAHVSNSLGTINPVEEIIKLAHSYGARVLVDGAQSTPHLPVNVSAMDADFFVFSGHKVFGPTGIGALYGKAELLESIPPWQGGGHMIKDVTFERTVYQHAPEKFEAGTPDIAGVVGLGAAIDYLFHLGIPSLAAYEHALLEYANHALATIPGLRPIGTAANKASVLSFVIPGVPNDQIARHLDRLGIAVRAGHHCALPAQRHFGLESTVRPSLAFYNTREEVDALVRGIRSVPRR